MLKRHALKVFLVQITVVNSVIKIWIARQSLQVTFLNVFKCLNTVLFRLCTVSCQIYEFVWLSNDMNNCGKVVCVCVHMFLWIHACRPMLDYVLFLAALELHVMICSILQSPYESCMCVLHLYLLHDNKYICACSMSCAYLCSCALSYCSVCYSQEFTLRTKTN